MLSRGIAKTGLVLKKKRNQYIAGLILFFILVSFVWLTLKPSETRMVVIGYTHFKLEIANSPQSRQKGLSGRDKLAEDQGMIFDFGQTGDWRVWMKDMHFDIDIAWLDEYARIVKIEQNVSPDTFPKTFYSDQYSRYIIELPAGTFNRLNVKVGDKIWLN